MPVLKVASKGLAFPAAPYAATKAMPQGVEVAVGVNVEVFVGVKVLVLVLVLLGVGVMVGVRVIVAVGVFVGVPQFPVAINSSAAILLLEFQLPNAIDVAVPEVATDMSSPAPWRPPPFPE
jgi:Flp pilus assembly protein TadB